VKGVGETGRRVVARLCPSSKEEAMRHLMMVPALAVLLVGPVWAQAGNPAGMLPGSGQVAPGVPAPHQPNAQDRLFVDQASIGGMAEVELGRLAERKAETAAVKAFAQRMIEDHTKANDQLMSLAKQANTPPAGSLDEEHQGVRANLEKLSGRPFDLAYIDGQIQDHQKTAQLLEWEIGSGQDPALKKFASEALPTVLQHLRLAQDLKTQLTGGGPQGVSTSATGGGGASAPQGVGAPSGIKR
jgi:putative membrane protein